MKEQTLPIGSHSLTPEEYERYSRQILLPEIGLGSQLILKSSRVLVVGIGGLGCPIALYLAAAGVGVLGLAESDNVELSNLQRQILYGTKAIGKPKVLHAKMKLEALNPHIDIRTHFTQITSENALDILSNYDIIVDGTDNFESRYLLNDCCILAGKPLVYGSVSQFKGLLSLVRPGEGPCYRCLYPNPPPIDVIPSCTEGGVFGVIPGTIALLQATEVLKHLLSIGNSLQGRVLFFDGLATSFKEIQLKRDPKCPSCGPFTPSRPSTSYSCPRDVQSYSTFDTTVDITVDQLKNELDANRPLQLIDVREPKEFLVSKIEQAELIPLGELPHRLSEISRDLKAVVYCRSGGRSAKALKILHNAGFTHARNLKGGIEAYKAAYKNLDNKQ